MWGLRPPQPQSATLQCLWDRVARPGVGGERPPPHLPPMLPPPRPPTRLRACNACSDHRKAPGRPAGVLHLQGWARMGGGGRRRKAAGAAQPSSRNKQAGNILTDSTRPQQQDWQGQAAAGLAKCHAAAMPHGCGNSDGPPPRMPPPQLQEQLQHLQGLAALLRAATGTTTPQTHPQQQQHATRSAVVGIAAAPGCDRTPPPPLDCKRGVLLSALQRCRCCMRMQLRPEAGASEHSTRALLGAGVWGAHQPACVRQSAPGSEASLAHGQLRAWMPFAHWSVAAPGASWSAWLCRRPRMDGACRGSAGRARRW